MFNFHRLHSSRKIYHEKAYTYTASLICVWDIDSNWCTSGQPCRQPISPVMPLKEANTLCL
jgi:hypothetical protein